MKNAILTAIDDNHKKRFEEDFIKTLKENAKYSGLVYLIYYGKNKEFISKMNKDPLIKLSVLKKEKIVNNQRNYDFLKTIKDLPREIEQIMLIDSGDVWFQHPFNELFDIVKETIGYVDEDIMADGWFNLKIINQIKNKDLKKEFLKYSKNQKLVNSGMIVGNKEKVKQLIEKAVKLDKIIKKDIFALDQTIINYLIKKENIGIRIPITYNYCLYSKRNIFQIINNIFYNKIGEKIKIVHNNGGEISRIFKNGREDLVFPKQFPKKLPGTFWGITSYFNPAKYKNKIENYRKFRESSKKQGLNLISVELAFGNEPFELTKKDADILIQVRSNSILWQKERLLNIGLKHLPKDCDKVAWLDCDILFMNNNWIQESSSLLEKYKVIQPFADCLRLPKNKCFIEKQNIRKYLFSEEDKENFRKESLGKIITKIGINQIKRTYREHGQTGFAWVSRKEIFDNSGFYDKYPLASGDMIMIQAMLKNRDYPIYQMQNKKMKLNINNWSKKMEKRVDLSVSYLPGTILHLWHGFVSNKDYGNIDKIVKKHNFNPDKDIKLNKNECWEWSNNKKKLKQEIIHYFIRRKEESNIKERIKETLIGIIPKNIDQIIGKIGISIKKKNSKIYYLLKRIV